MFDFGVVAFLQPACRCQKQPLTNTTVRHFGSVRSGRPGKSFRCSRNLRPSRCAALRTSNSGPDPFERTARIISERLPLSTWSDMATVGISRKKPIIQWLYEKRTDPITGALVEPRVTTDEVQEAIRWGKKQGIDLSEKNPANFLKDLIRKTTANSNWPEKITAARITARQVTGDGMCFEFVPFKDDQTEPFPDRFKPDTDTPVRDLESTSLPLASKALGRSDESWLIQVAVRQRVIETHFAITSALPAIEVSHLQTSVKLRKTEIDALFLARCDGMKNETYDVLITCEAKKKSERILEEQIEQQMRAALLTKKTRSVVPIVIQSVHGKDRRGVYVAEFRELTLDDIDSFEELEPTASCIYRLVPPVVGI